MDLERDRLASSFLALSRDRERDLEPPPLRRRLVDRDRERRDLERDRDRERRDLERDL
jgi:hypothetical protein